MYNEATYEALGHAPHLVYEPMTEEDLEGWKDCPNGICSLSDEELALMQDDLDIF